MAAALSPGAGMGGQPMEIERAATRAATDIAHDLGQRAGRRRHLPHECPYHPDTPQALAWYRGWRTGFEPAVAAELRPGPVRRLWAHLQRLSTTGGAGAAREPLLFLVMVAALTGLILLLGSAPLHDAPRVDP